MKQKEPETTPLSKTTPSHITATHAQTNQNPTSDNSALRPLQNVQSKSNDPYRQHDVTRSEPNLIGSEPEPVILKSVPSLKELTENEREIAKNINAKLRSTSNVNHRLFLQSKSLAVDTRPIYPNCPFSPYGSPTNSPRSNRKRQPLKESRRVSIEKSGMYLQLNQYKLMDSIGQVRNCFCYSVSALL